MRPVSRTVFALGIAAALVAIVLPSLSAPLRRQFESRGVVRRTPPVRPVAVLATQASIEPLTAFGAPLPGLNAAQTAAFAAGRRRSGEVVDRVEQSEPSEHRGPSFAQAAAGRGYSGPHVWHLISSVSPT